jgi:ACS family hexuronate transporter-like MFS transporter
MIFPLLVSNILYYFKHAGNKAAGYHIIFIICGCAYLVAWLLMHVLSPRMKPIDLYAS